MNTPSLQASRKTKKTQVGDIPVDWEVCKLGRLVSIQSGASPSLHALKSDGLYPFVKVEDLNNCLKYQAESREYSDSAAELIRIGSVIFPKRGAAISTNKVRLAARPLLMDSNMMAIFPDEGRLVSEFLYYTILFQKLYRIADTSTIPQINNKHITPYAIALPPLAEQKKIAAVLGLCDKAVEKQEHRLAWQHQFKQGLMQQLLTGRTRFKEFVKSHKSNVTHFGPFPADWPVVYFGGIADEIGEKNVGGNDLPVLSCTKYRGLVNSLEYFGKRIFSEDTSTYKVVRRGDFAFATNHIEEGSIGYQNLHDAALISPMYTVFRSRDGVDHSFLFKLVKTELYRHIFEANTNGSINRRGALRWDDFARLKVHLPSEPEQKRIAAVLDTCDREIELLEKQLEALKEQKRGLMQKLLTGEVRVKVGKEN
ncbi:MAG: restriction endonuclease subunit S [Verrucomicrobiota bacterium]|jgi:type I restriction enzyme S subunit